MRVSSYDQFYILALRDPYIVSIAPTPSRKVELI